ARGLPPRRAALPPRPARRGHRARAGGLPPEAAAAGRGAGRLPALGGPGLRPPRRHRVARPDGGAPPGARGGGAAALSAPGLYAVLHEPPRRPRPVLLEV